MATLKERLRKDTISVSIRRDKYKQALKSLFEISDGRDMSEKIFEAIEFYNRNQGRKDRTYREDEPENWKNYMKGDAKMKKDDLIEFVRDQWGEPEFKSTDGPLEERSTPFLKGYVATKLDMDIDTLEERGIGYLSGFMAANDGKVDSADLRKDRVDTSRVDELKKQRLNIGEDREDKSVEELQEERLKLYDGIDERVEEMVEDKEAEGKDVVTALKEARIELFQEDN